MVMRGGGALPRQNEAEPVTTISYWREEILVGTARFELATPCTPSKCATRLRYVPTESAVEDDSVGSTLEFYTSGQAAARAWLAQ